MKEGYNINHFFDEIVEMVKHGSLFNFEISGVFLQMYHGDVINHWQKYMSNIYIVCDKTATEVKPMFEHIKSDISQAHFKIKTKQVC